MDEFEKNRVYDVAIIGGGINGAGIALDAALRGLSVLLIDKDDFASHTTSASTKLIHGGLRYLEYYEFPLVRESLRERERILKNAPHLAWPLKLNVPIYNHSSRGPLLIKTGMIFYDLLSYDKSLPGHSLTTGKKMTAIEPSLNQHDLKAIASYYDCQVGYPERLCLEVLLSAKEAGAKILNYHELSAYKRKDNSTAELLVKDKKEDKSLVYNAKVVVNAGGIFVDKICNMVNEDIPRKMGGTKGSHILINKFKEGPINALYIESVQDGRPFFIIPWRDYYLVGTTDIYYEGNLDNITATNEEIEYLLYELNYFLPEHKFTVNDVLYSYSGIRPLPYEPGKSESQVTRRHIIFEHGKNGGPDNFISIIGGKLTTYRSLAEECVDRICSRLDIDIKSTTANYPLVGAPETKDVEVLIASRSSQFSDDYDLPRETVDYLIRFYGSKFEDVLDLCRDNPTLKNRICEHNPEIKAQIVYSVKEEMAKNLEDILLRRTSIGTSKCLGLDCVQEVADVAGKYFNWNKNEIEENVLNYKIKIQNRFAGHRQKRTELKQQKGKLVSV